MLKNSVNLYGLDISDVSLERAREIARVSLSGGESRVFFTPNLEMLEAARRNEKIRDLLNFASVLLPDGIGVLLVSELLGTPIKNKVAGIDFGEAIVALAEKEGKKIFLLGGKIGVAKLAAKNLIKKHPNLKVCGLHCGYFEGEENTVLEKIRRAAPDILIVCMGFPRQEKFVYTYREELSTIGIIACLGGTMDVWAGKKKRAPLFFRRANLEWAWRVAAEPKRLVRLIKSLPVIFDAVENKKTATSKRIKP
jgi:N-acetylglucosaminyldiphosphoundecaprenol N-acetyl-beta-D-mannosaminyltransferase